MNKNSPPEGNTNPPPPPSWAIKIAGFIVGIGFIFTAANFAFEPVREFSQSVWDEFAKNSGEDVSPIPFTTTECHEQFASSAEELVECLHASTM